MKAEQSNMKSDEREIDGLLVKTVQLPAMRAFKLLARLVKAVGPALGVLTKLDPSAQLDAVAGEIAGAFASLDADEAERLVPEILTKTTVFIPDDRGGSEKLLTKERIDDMFTGRLMTLFRVLGFVLQVNFQDFYAGSAPAAPQSPAPSAA